MSPQGAPRAGENRPVPLRPIPVQSKADLLVAADPEAEPPPAELITPLTVSPWLVSSAVHFVIVIVLAFIVFPPDLQEPVALEVVYAESLGVQLENDILTSGFENPELTDAALAIDMHVADDPLAAPPQLIDVAANTAGLSSNVEAPTIGLALTGREVGSKKALLGGYGGTETTESAVERGLEWLKKTQRADGTWSLQGPFSNGATTENVTSATAMALLAFQGAGNTPTSGKYQKTVAKGWKALLAMQDREGNFVQEASLHQRLYAQAQATIAICELYGMTRNSQYAAPAELAIQYAIKAQSSEGGWRYEPAVDADTSVTGWFVMALQSARMARMEVPQSVLDKATRFLDSVATADGVRYRYQASREPDEVMTAEAMLCRQYLGWKREDQRMQQAADYVLSRPLSYGPGEQNVYYWYYATQFMHHLEGTHWDRWNRTMRQAIPMQQIQSGREAGSWDPGDDEWGAAGGRLYVTCLSIYMLEVYYRHLPLYSDAAVIR
jgi:hypothetical protein